MDGKRLVGEERKCKKVEKTWNMILQKDSGGCFQWCKALLVLVWERPTIKYTYYIKINNFCGVIDQSESISGNHVNLH